MSSNHFTAGFIEADNLRIRYLDGGNGQPIICLHIGGSPLSAAYELLAHTFRVVAFELPEGSASVEDLARSLNAAASALGIERYSLLGTSFGSEVALWMAILRPEAVDAIVLSAPGACEKRAAELPHPVLVVFGTVDEPSPSEGARLYRESLQNCHITLVYGAAAAIDAERPEAFASLAGDFLSRKDQFVVSQTSAVIHP